MSRSRSGSSFRLSFSRVGVGVHPGSGTRVGRVEDGVGRGGTVGTLTPRRSRPSPLRGTGLLWGGSLQTDGDRGVVLVLYVSTSGVSDPENHSRKNCRPFYLRAGLQPHLIPHHDHPTSRNRERVHPRTVTPVILTASDRSGPGGPSRSSRVDRGHTDRPPI